MARSKAARSKAARDPQTAQSLSAAAAQMGRRGGIATAASQTPEERKARASKAAMARWKKQRAQ